MKIAIKGHASRGKEVIEILENLGGVNRCPLNGSEITTYYYINYNSDNAIHCHDTDHINNHCKKYTLEEFETQFPFKIGDTILLKGVTKPYKIIALELYMNKLCYKLDNGLHYDPETLIIYEKMKEERNITLTLDKAKEWYKKGGELKEIALQAFSEKELNPLPRSWEEFCKNYPIKPEEICINGYSKFIVSNVGYRNSTHDKNICPSRKSAEAHLAMIQLEQLRNCWWGDWRPEWNDGQQTKYCIIHSQEFKIQILYVTRRFLSFPTIEMAEEFLKCFKDLIEKAGNLL